MSRIVYGTGGFRPAHPSLGKVKEHNDDLSTYTTWNDAGAVVEQRPYTAEETAIAAALAAATTTDTNRSTIEQRAQQALAANETFLALASPTNAQNAAQIKLLTRECQGLIRLAIKALDSLNGT
jgi:hypothetical protein